MTTSFSTSAKLEPFLLMAKSAKGMAAGKLIESATSAPGVFVFAELLDSPSVAELASNTQMQPHLELLKLFSYGTYADYKQNQSSLPPLNEAQITKLKQLSIVSLATERRILPYDQLMSLLEIASIRALEDLIIDAIYAELLRAKLDQKNKQLEVQYTLGRDLRPGQLEQLLGALRDWSNRTSSVMTALDNKLQQIETADQQKKQDQTAYDAARQQTVSEIIAAAAVAQQQQQQQQHQQQSLSSNAPSKFSTTSFSRRALGALAQTSGGGSQQQGQGEDMMDVDPAPSSSGRETRKKPTSNSPATGGAGPAARKRARGGQ